MLAYFSVEDWGLEVGQSANRRTGNFLYDIKMALLQKVEWQKVEWHKVEWQKVEWQKVERSKGRTIKR